MYPGSLTTIDDLSEDQIVEIIELAAEMLESRDEYAELARHQIMASLFFETSTRTRGSFESAMNRLGGRVITVADAASSSVEKGETLADTVRIWGGYADLIALRHPWEGAARLAAEYADVPVINAGDGAHEHPTQTLVDLFTLWREYGRLSGLKIAICGDLKRNRSVHSLIHALLRFGVEFYLVPARGLKLPDSVSRRIAATAGVSMEEMSSGPFEPLFQPESGGASGASLSDSGLDVDVLYITNVKPNQPTLIPSPSHRGKKRWSLNSEELALYLTRRQIEREPADEEEASGNGGYFKVTGEVLGRSFKRAIVMHPLPRVDEIAREVDAGDRARYFEQARYGVPIRQALIAKILDLKQWEHSAEKIRVLVRDKALRCTNPECVAQREPGSCTPYVTVYSDFERRIACTYCDQDLDPQPTVFRIGGGVVYHELNELKVDDPELLSRVTFFTDAEEASRNGLHARSRRPRSRVYVATPDGQS